MFCRYLPIFSLHNDVVRMITVKGYVYLRAAINDKSGDESKSTSSEKFFFL